MSDHKKIKVLKEDLEVYNSSLDCVFANAHNVQNNLLRIKEFEQEIERLKNVNEQILNESAEADKILQQLHDKYNLSGRYINRETGDICKIEENSQMK